MIFLKNIETPIGNIQAACTELGIFCVEFIDVNSTCIFIKKYSEKNNVEIVIKPHQHLNTLQEQLNLYFKKELKKFTLPLLFEGTVFQQKVWQHLQSIPFGKTISYKTQALQMKNILGIRAIASANGQNPIAIIIPCHRVIGSNGSLTGYAGGLHRKKYLLALENEKVVELF